MLRRFDLAMFERIASLPSKEHNEWLSQAIEGASFLTQNALASYIVIFASSEAGLVQGVLAPAENITAAAQHELLRTWIQLDDTWVIQRSWSSAGHRMYLDPPMSSAGKALVGGEKLIFRRTLEGVLKVPQAPELSQKLVHSLGLHFLPDRNAYCRLDDRGDVQEVIRIISKKNGKDDREKVLVTIRSEDLHKYMALSGTVLVQRFDFTRFKLNSFVGWNGGERFNVREADLFYDGQVIPGHASYINGCHIVRPNVTIDELVEHWKAEQDPASRQYATFKIVDRKNQRMVETSCAPGFLSNYFQDSSLPWEISPAFFRADVLHRFKADPEKYTLDERSISCRNAWHLKTYDINAEGQVHTYIGYLAGLPYDEQVYWQSFNEWPKGPISKRAFENDILGEWSTDYNPLLSIKRKVIDLDRDSPAWWQSRGESLLASTQYPATESSAEWADEIMRLDQLVVEGFLEKPLRTIAKSKGRTLDDKWRTLKLLEECLIGLGMGSDDVKAFVAPMRELHDLRSVVRAHSSIAKRQAAESSARESHGTLRDHHRDLAGRCDKSLDAILKALEEDA